MEREGLKRRLAAILAADVVGYWNGADHVVLSEVSPWIDCLFPSKEERLEIVEHQSHRRFLKSHLPVDTIVFSPKAKYLYIGRDGRDALWSLYNHHKNLKKNVIDSIDSVPERIGPPLGYVRSKQLTQNFKGSGHG